MRTAAFCLLTILCLMLTVAPAIAQGYSNGPINGTTDAWTINFGFSVSDSFTCASDCTVDGLHIGVWLFPGDNVGSVEILLGSSSFGNQYGELVLNATGYTDLGINQYGYDIQQVDFMGGQVLVPRGTNWLTLQNAVETQFGDPIYWDENSGPSLAFENSAGSIPSEAFTLNGCSGCVCGVPGPDCGPPIPEPSSIMLFGSGILGLVGVLRRKLGR